jgi:methyl-accepting chemotaxis protein
VDQHAPGKTKNRLEWLVRLQPFSSVTRLWHRLKIVSKLRIGFGVLILLMLIGYGWAIAAGHTATEEINRTTNLRAPLALASGRAQANWLRMEADVQAYLALGDKGYRVDHGSTKREFEANILELQALLAQSQDVESPEFKELSQTLVEIRDHYDEWNVLVSDLFELRDDQLRREPALGILIVDAAPYINAIIVDTTSIINTQKQQEATDRGVEVLSAMYNFQSSFYAMIAGLRGYVTTARPGFKFEYQANQDVNTQAWKTIQSNTDLLTPSQLVGLSRIESARKQFLLHPEHMFNAVEGPNARTDLRLFRDEAVPLSDRMLYLLDTEATFQQVLLQSELNRGREQLASAQIISICSAIVAILAGLLLALAIASSIALPIQRLTNTAQLIQAGDLGARAEVTTGDEIGILGNVFNSMTSKLRETLQSLWDYLEQVKVVMSAAAAVEENRYEPSSLDGLAKRDDALGQLARVFQKMAREVRLREEHLKQQVQELKIVLDESRQQQKVSEITETDYFKSLQREADALRGIISGGTNEQEHAALQEVVESTQYR